MTTSRVILHWACVLVCAGLTAGTATGEDTMVRLQLDLSDTKDVTIEDAGGGAFRVQTTGGDPYVYTQRLDTPLPLDGTPVLAFEYFTTTPTEETQVYFDPPTSETHSMRGKGLGHSEGWTSFAMDLSEAREAWPEAPTRLRIDFGRHGGRTFQLRNMVLRAPTARELELAAGREARRVAEAELDRELRAYLDADYPCAVTKVAVTDTEVVVHGTLDGREEGLSLAESPLYEHLTRVEDFASLTPLAGDGTFKVTLDRFVPGPEGQRDRLLSRWAVVERKGTGLALASHARYADTVTPKHDLPREVVRTKKGLGGFAANRGHLQDLEDLGVSSITVNIFLGFMRREASDRNLSWAYNGKTYYADRRSIESLDRTFITAAEHDQLVLGIILVPNGGGMADVLRHPDCDPAGIFSMANVTSQEGLDYYAAAMELLASRYSRPDKKYGRIHHYIIHNEVDAGWVWTNAGEKTPLLYLDLYHKSMRTAHLVARQYSAHSQAFISLTHHWNWTSDRHFHLSKELLELLVDFSRAEGDFEWAVAQHPYPQSLFEPRVWEDEKVDFTLDTPLITYKNIEVLAAWARQPETWYQGREKRVIMLTEQGLNSKDYSEQALLDQAAGMAYAWKKFSVLPEIHAFQYHNWFDNRGEGGLRLGLRRFPDDETDPGGLKPIWKVYQGVGTEREDEVCNFALEHIGISNWDEVRHTGEIR